MTINEAIASIDAVKPNVYPSGIKVAWLSELDGRVCTDVMMCTPPPRYSDTEDGDTGLIIGAPFESVYTAYLDAMIDYRNGEYEKYANSLAVFNEKWDSYAKWYERSGKYAG